ncbi:hypothetical protein DDZ13_11710 [Coraliomargarita sinensis]|uniref:RND transporter n=1 Tax=Coraliomargarita sinensis TaxID=2174842 RepID=A0A317ZDP1_9BACT|nr:efflux transporter outer membrane subunit [Coraliomargarita sinensis]PXA03356.1 hypothetical protein DDZ13_11710 [Coraliomargarita sinensis]
MPFSRKHDYNTVRHLSAALLLSACALVSACTQGVAPAQALSPVETTFSVSGSAERRAEWWKAFDDPQLNRLIDEALSDSPSLEAIWERLQANEALARRERSALFPQLDGILGASSEREDNEGTELFSVGLYASYEVDLWGRIRSEAEAERLRAEATKADYETAALTLSGQVALTWYRLLARTEILALIEDQIAANEKVAESLIARFRGGEARSVDVLRQEQLIEATRELKLIAEADIAVLENQLQVLLGNTPQKNFASDSHAELPALPPLPNTGLPGELLLRRPDLKSAYLELLAADQDLASAISERFPRIDLTASVRSASEDSSKLFDDWIRSIAGELVAPIIDGGNRRAEVDRQTAIKRQRVAEFKQASIVAYREVEDALVQEKQETLRHASLSKQVELQQTAFKQLQKEFLNGVGNFIDVLTAQTGAQELQRNLIESKRRQIEFRIALHRSIAGPIQAYEKRKQP